MKDKFSFEDNIKNKMEEFNDVPSPKIWQQLEQSNPSHSTTQKSLIMKSTMIILASLISIFIGYNFIKGDSIIRENPLEISFDSYLEASERAEKEGKILFLDIIKKEEKKEDCPTKDCPEAEKERQEKQSKELDREIEKMIADHFIRIEVDIDNVDYSAFFDKYDISNNGESLFFKAGNLQARLFKYSDMTNNKNNLKDYLHFLVTGERIYKGSVRYLDENGDLIEHPVKDKTQAFINTNNKAKEKGKIILAKITMEGCTFCGKMEKETLLDKEVVESLEDAFIPLDMDIFDPNYKSFLEHYNIKATPTYLFLTPDGNLLSKVAGFRPKDVFLDAVESALENNITKTYIPIEKPEVQKDLEKPKLKASSKLKIKVYPNPSNGNFKLDIQGEKGTGTIQFTDINGRFLLKEKINDLEHLQTLEYDFSNQNQSIIVTIQQGKNIATEKIIINK